MEQSHKERKIAWYTSDTSFSIVSILDQLKPQNPQNSQENKRSLWSHSIANKKTHTILCQASARGHAQLKHQKLRVGSYVEEVLEWVTIPGCEVSCQGVSNWPASLLCLCFVEASQTVEKAVSCRKADLPVAMLSSLCNIRKFYATNTGVFETDVVAPEAHQNNRSNVREISGSTFDSLRTDLAWWVFTWMNS